MDYSKAIALLQRMQNSAQQKANSVTEVFNSNIHEVALIVTHTPFDSIVPVETKIIIEQPGNPFKEYINHYGAVCSAAVMEIQDSIRKLKNERSELVL